MTASRACRAIRASTTRRPRRAASGNRPTAASPGSRSSTTSRPPRSARSRSRRPTRTSSTSAPARRTSAATSRPATASTSHSTPARPGRTSGSEVGQIGTMIVHPRNPDVAFAAVLGHAFGPNPERGVYRTQRRRQDVAAGAEEGRRHRRLRRRLRSVEPATSLFAGFWQARRKPWDLVSGGPGSGLYVSRDGGDTWKPLDRQGTARRHLGQGRRCGRAVGRPPRLRADRGREGRPLPIRRRRRDLGARRARTTQLRQRAWYYSTMTVDPAERRRRLVPAGADAADASTAARRSSASRGFTTAIITTSGSTRRTRGG